MSGIPSHGLNLDAFPTVTVDGRTLAGDALRAEAEAFAGRVRGAGPIAVDASASLETVVAVLGCLIAGVPAVPVPPDAGPREREHILRDSGAVFAADVDRSRAGPVDAALILYTSGTTGAPKGVPISAAAIDACLDGLIDAWSWTPEDTLVHGLPLFHVHGLVLGVLGALRAGSPLVHTGRPTPAAYAAAGGSLYFGVPTVWGRVAASSSASALRSARLLVSGSAGLPRPVFDALKSLTGQGPLERYGMTETLITLAARADAPRVPGSVGGPVAGVEGRLVDVADGIGSLQVRGATVFDGYLGGGPVGGRSDGSFDGWFDTGDAASLVDGTYRILGRTKDDLIKTGGYRVGAVEIESVLLDHPSVREAAVIGVPDDDLGQRIVAYVVGSAVHPEVLIEHVATQLSVHKRPREVRVVDALPRNALGKVQKGRLS